MLHLLSLVVSVCAHLVHGAAPQTPLHHSDYTSISPSESASVSDNNPSFIFRSVNGLLRQLPNTFSPNGFSVVPATIPAFTNLYHARKDSGPIPKVEWVAFDAEMSYGIMGGRGGETWMHTYMTTRDVRVLVFDGMSAALMGERGTLDSQKVFLYGEVKNDTGRRPGREGGGGHGEPGPVFDEYTRAEDLCRWAASLEGARIEGFVRMNAGFEAVWCDFENSDSWKLVSKLNVTAPAKAIDRLLDTPPDRRPPGGPPYGPPRDGRGVPWSNAAVWEWIRSATWHYSLSPESRVIPDTCRFFTYYSPDFASFPHDLTTRKDFSHRLVNVTKEDAAAFKAQIGESLVATDMPCSGLDWQRVTQDIMERYGGRIKELEIVLSSNTTNATTKAEKAGILAFGGIMPFVSDSKRDGAQERCSTAYTAFIPEGSLSPQEVLLRHTVEQVVGRICQLFISVYFEQLEHPPSEYGVLGWKRNTVELVEWLDWDMWRRCERQCAWDEVCAVPLWPVLGMFDWDERITPECVNSTVLQNRRRSPPGKNWAVLHA
ncbi:hypothetical protein FN846DRAFT_977158 [Sphaerosporella brunnea]|uniref:Uncharacterized protein n=1 Tax=Sphaerosporella brunnea TaxID=1250544 RepID=A0A5J5EFX6_9PEZI|nr:hypothetical protein FN846DRAFT_977158 [Sphaerosporella brunnea]